MAERSGCARGKLNRLPRERKSAFAEIKLAPETVLIHLTEVLVLVGKN